MTDKHCDWLTHLLTDQLAAKILIDSLWLIDSDWLTNIFNKILAQWWYDWLPTEMIFELTDWLTNLKNSWYINKLKQRNTNLFNYWVTDLLNEINKYWINI